MKWRAIMTLMFAAGSCCAARAVEPNETFATATVLAPGVLSVNDSLYPGVANFPDTVLGIRDHFGEVYFVNDDDSPVGDGHASGIGGVPTNSGSIDFAVSGYPDEFFFGGHVEYGGYEVFVDVYDFFDDPVDSFSEVRTLGPGEVHEFSFNDFEWIGGSYDVYIDNTVGLPTNGDVDFFTFTDLTPGASFTAETLHINPNAIDTLLGWFDANGDELLLDDDGGEGSLSKIVGTVPAGGDLTFAVSGYGDDAFVGSHVEDNIYELRITLEAGGTPGDYNGNGVVDAADYAVWRDTLGSTTNLIADGSGNGTVDTGDYNFWRARFGATAGYGAGGNGSASAQAVPEPTGDFDMAAWIVVILGARGLSRNGRIKNPSAKYLKFLVLLFMLFAACDVASAVDNLYQGPDNGSWNVSANWSFVPPDVNVNEAAVISNFATVVLAQHAKTEFAPGAGLFDTNVGGLRLGATAGSSGGLRIVSGGNLPNVASTTGNPMETGAIAVGVAGQGNLTIFGNGMLSGTSLVLGGSDGSSITLSDTASLTVSGVASLQRTTTIIGPNVNFSAGGDLTLDPASTLVADIRHLSLHSPLNSNGTAIINGTFKPMFMGVIPMLGNKWTVIDAATAINGTFANLDLSMAPPLPAGQSYQIIQSTSGTRKLLQLSVKETSLPGDYNGDGVVNAADYAVWRDTLGSTTNLIADGSGNGTVDTGDYNFWRARFGSTAGRGSGLVPIAAASAHVPEPTAMAIAATLAGALLGCRRKLSRFFPSNSKLKGPP